MSTADAVAFIDEAIDALSIEMHRSKDPDRHGWSKVEAIEATIAVHLERVDSAIGPRGQSMFAPLAENVKQAMAALHGARQALKPESQP